LHRSRVAKLLEATDLRSDLARFDKLSAMHCRESTMMATLATRMRLPQQSSYDARRTKESPTIRKPWEMAASARNFRKNTHIGTIAGHSPAGHRRQRE
jgi:hypothetical protein